MKYLKLFNTNTEYETYMGGGEVILPNVSFVVSGEVHFNPKQHTVFIQHMNGDLYTLAQWANNSFSNDLSNGVAVVTNEVQFVIAKDLFSKIKWNPTNTTVSGATIATTEAQALSDVNGYHNTEIIAPYDSTNGIISTCVNYTFPNGKKGYCPALGELKIMCDNIEEIISALELIGGTPFSSTYMFSSTQYDKWNVWQIWYKNGSVIYADKSSVNYISFRPFTTID